MELDVQTNVWVDPACQKGSWDRVVQRPGRGFKSVVGPAWDCLVGDLDVRTMLALSICSSGLRRSVRDSSKYWETRLQEKFPYAQREGHPFVVYVNQCKSCHVFAKKLHPQPVPFPSYHPPFDRFAAHGFTWAGHLHIATPAQGNTSHIVIEKGDGSEHARFALPKACWQLLFSPTTAGGALLCSDWKGNISVYSVAKQKVVQTWPGTEYSSFRMARCEWEGKPAIVAGGQKVRFLDPTDGRLLHSIDLGDSYTAIHDLVTVKLGGNWHLIVKYLDTSFQPHVCMWNLSRGTLNLGTLPLSGRRPQFIMHNGFPALVTSQDKKWMITEFRPDKVAALTPMAETYASALDKVAN